MINQRRLREAMGLHTSAQLSEAAEKYDKLLALDPSLPGVWHLRGVLAGQQGDYPASIAMIRHAISLDSGQPEYYRNLIITLRNMGDAAGEAQACNGLGAVLQAQMRFDEAMAAYRQALAANPADGLAMNNLGAVLNDLHRYEEAIEWLEPAIANLQDAGRIAGATMNLGFSWLSLNQPERALVCFDGALGHVPPFAEAHVGRARALLASGRFEEGLRETEWRWQCTAYRQYARNVPMWVDEKPGDFEGRLVVTPEQGYGDAIQFVRYVPLLVERGYDIVVETTPELQALFAETLSPLGIEVVSQIKPLDSLRPPVTRWVGLLSLATRLDRAAEIYCPAMPCLAVPDSRREAWRNRMRPDPAHLRVGLVWSGNPVCAHDAARSLPPELLEPLLGREGVTFHALQKGANAGYGFAGGPVEDLAPDLHDFADTAAAIEALDLVIAVDTAVAHLAGSLNKPVWVLLSKRPEWRWALEGETTPWYPSARLFHQPEPGNWDAVLQAVGAALDELIAS